MPQIKAGSVAVENGSATIIASAGVDWLDVPAGALLNVVADGTVLYQIAATEGPTMSASGRWEATLTAPYAGATNPAAAPYSVSIDFTPNRGLPLIAAGDISTAALFSRAMMILDSATDGSPGPQGAQGNQGAQGAQGTAGSNGSQGFQGFQGAQGAQGDQGATGAQDGAQGPQGAAGPDGNQGPDGAQGAQGAPGPDGNQGADGWAGADGDQGAQGPEGPQGAQGPAGAQGDPGPQGVSG